VPTGKISHLNTTISSRSSKETYFRLLRYVTPYWRRLAIAMGILALLAFTEPLFPALMKPLLDEGFTNQNESYIRWIPVILVGLFVLRGTLAFSASFVSAWISNRIIADIRKELFDHLLALPASFYDKNSSARLSSHVTYDVLNVSGAANGALNIIVRDSLTVVGLFAWLLWLDWKLTSITLAMLPLIAITVRYFNKRLRKISSQGQYSMANITHNIEEISTNNRLVKIFNAENFEKIRFNKYNEENRMIGMRATVASSAVSPLVQVITSLSIASIIAIALNSSSEGTASAGGFVSFLTALMLLLPPIKRLTDITSVIQKGLAAAELIFSILDEKREESPKHNHKNNSKKLDGDIDIRNITFAYDINERKALSDVSISIKKNQRIALVGRSGSGKSTLIQLLAGFYPLQEGDILINGRSMRKLPLEIIRKNISYVSQDVRLFNNSISYNVSYGDHSPNKESIINALKSANAWEFVETLPEGINTQIGQNGVKLSGGQKQRISIARAFYKDAPILILDEATSALDTESERKIQAALEALTNGRTSISIAHRLSTIENSEKIFVLEDGKISQQGTHIELINAGGIYSHLHALQNAESGR